MTSLALAAVPLRVPIPTNESALANPLVDVSSQTLHLPLFVPDEFQNQLKNSVDVEALEDSADR